MYLQRASWRRLQRAKGVVCAQALTPEAALAPAHLQDDDQKEVEVGHAVELLVQVQGQEGEEVVLGRVDDVVLEREPGSKCRPGQRSPAHPAPPGLAMPSGHDQL